MHFETLAIAGFAPHARLKAPFDGHFRRAEKCVNSRLGVVSEPIRAALEAVSGAERDSGRAATGKKIGRPKPP